MFSLSLASGDALSGVSVLASDAALSTPPVGTLPGASHVGASPLEPSASGTAAVPSLECATGPDTPAAAPIAVAQCVQAAAPPLCINSSATAVSGAAAASPAVLAARTRSQSAAPSNPHTAPDSSVPHCSAPSRATTVVLPLLPSAGAHDLSTLQCAASAALDPAGLPAFVLSALKHCKPSARTHDATARERFSLAVVLALRAHYTGVFLSPPPSKSGQVGASEFAPSVSIGIDIPDVAVRALCAELSFPSGDRHTSVLAKGYLYGAVRVLLQALHEESTAPHSLCTFFDHAFGQPVGTAAADFASSAAAIPAAAAVPPPLVSVVSIPGDNEQCFFRAVGLALGLTGKPAVSASRPGLQRWSKIASHIRKALDSIQDAAVLASFGMAVDPTADAAGLAAAKQTYLASTQFADQRWGGTLEMHLLAHSYAGSVAFLVVNPLARPDYQFRLAGALPHSSAQGHPAQHRTEVALHHCSLTGVAGGDPNHWELVQYGADPDTATNTLADAHLESAQARTARYEAILTACAASTKRRQHAASKAEQRNARAAQALQEKHRKAPFSPQLQPSAAPPIASVAAAQAAAGTCLPCHSTRVKMWRVLPRSSRKLFLTVVTPLLKRYAEASAAGDRSQCDRLLSMFLDLPARALRKSNKRVLGQSLCRSMDLYRQMEAGMNTPTDQECDGAEESTHSLMITPSAASDSSPASTPCCEDDTASVASESTAPTDDLLPVVRRACAIVHEGGARALSRATNALMQLPPAVISPDTVRQLLDLHPPAPPGLKPLPDDSAPKLVEVGAASLLRVLKRRVDNGSAPGPSGWTGSHLRVIAESSDPDAPAGLTALVKDICNGEFTGAAKRRLLASVLTPLSKAAGSSAIRPIAMGEVLVKLAAHYCMSLFEDELPRLFPRIQYGVKRPGGSESAAQLIRATLAEAYRLDPTSVAIQIDFANAFNTADRKGAWERLLATPKAESMWRMFHWAYADPSDLLLYDRASLYALLQSQEGVRQGCPFASFAFALLVQPLYEQSIRELPAVKGISVLDDLTLIGPLAHVVTALARMKSAAADFHLQLRLPKCKLYAPPEAWEDPLTRAAIEAAAQECSIECTTTLLALGVLHGTDSAVQQYCMANVESHERLFSALQHPAMPAQVAFALLRYCAQPRMSFLARTVQPHNIQQAATRFDSMLLQCFYSLTQLEHRGSTDQAPHMSAAQLAQRVSLPLHRGGMGLRPVTRVSTAAYFSSLAAVMADFVQLFPECTEYTSTQIHQQLEQCRQQLQQQGAITPKPKQLKRQPKGKLIPALPAAPVPANTSQHPVGPRILCSPLATMWQEASRCVAVGKQPSEFLQVDHLQQLLTTRIEDGLYDAHFASATRYQQVLLTSVSSSPGSHAFLTVLPVEKEHRMDSLQFRLAVRHHMGLVPYDSLLGQKCRMCTSQASFSDDPDHFHSCSKHKRTLGTARHSDLMGVVCRLARSVGYYASREPNDHVRPQGVHMTDDEYNKHADILLLKEDQRLYVDVSVTRTTQASKIKQGDTSKPSQAAEYRARDKHRKYDEICRLNGYTMVPFVVESTGALAMEAQRLLRTLSQHAHCSDLTPTQWLTNAYNTISVVLQKANARLAQAGVHAQSIDQTRWEHKQASQRKWLQSKRNSTHTVGTHSSNHGARARTVSLVSDTGVSVTASVPLHTLTAVSATSSVTRPTVPPLLRNPCNQRHTRSAKRTSEEDQLTQARTRVTRSHCPIIAPASNRRRSVSDDVITDVLTLMDDGVVDDIGGDDAITQVHSDDEAGDMHVPVHGQVRAGGRHGPPGMSPPTGTVRRSSAAANFARTDEAAGDASDVVDYAVHGQVHAVHADMNDGHARSTSSMPAAGTAHSGTRGSGGVGMATSGGASGAAEYVRDGVHGQDRHARTAIHANA